MNLASLSLDALYDRADILRDARKAAEARGNMREADRLRQEYRPIIDEITRRNLAKKRRNRT